MSTAGSDLDKAAELLVNEQKADLILNREQLAKLRVLMGQIASAAQGAQKELAHFLKEEVRGLILAHVEDAASAAGRAQAQHFVQEVAAEARNALEESSDRATEAANSLDQASKQLRQNSVLRAAGIAAGGSFGIVAALIVAAWFYLPSKSEMESLRTERAQLQASIEDLSKRGGRVMHTCAAIRSDFVCSFPHTRLPGIPRTTRKRYMSFRSDTEYLALAADIAGLALNRIAFRARVS
jgi:hypothetical protein